MPNTHRLGPPTTPLPPATFGNPGAKNVYYIHLRAFYGSSYERQSPVEPISRIRQTGARQDEDEMSNLQSLQDLRREIGESSFH
ncbi:hypothetical protein NL676_013022 [Syzygium grande]|nr:hypothetical protein NL676_013022 [Syzygium grande]